MYNGIKQKSSRSSQLRKKNQQMFFLFLIHHVRFLDATLSFCVGLPHRASEEEDI